MELKVFGQGHMLYFFFLKWMVSAMSASTTIRVAD